MPRFPARSIALGFALCGLAGCGRSDAPRGVPNAETVAVLTPEGTPYAYSRIALDTTRKSGGVIDSVFPMPEMMRRFRVNLPELRALDGGAASRQALATEFVAALSSRDKATLGRLTLSRAEFAWLYFPITPNAARDNGLPPTLMWDQITLASEKGIGRALDRIGGRGALTLERLDCPKPPVTQGPATLHEDCTLVLRNADGAEYKGRLFGPILEYGGRFKFIGYTNDM